MGSGPDRDLVGLLDELGLDRAAVSEIHHLTRRLVAEGVAEVVDASAAGESPIPAVDHDELTSLDDARRDLVRRRGCLVVRGTFAVDEAAAWNDELGEYLDRNRFFDQLAERDPERAASGSGISPIYWSKPQVAARQHPRMVAVRRFLNSLWSTDEAGARPFDADHDIGYADRIRWRRPGAAACGLPLHCDSPATGGWREPENRSVFRHVLAGCPERHDPWDATHRTDVRPGMTSPSAVFRTFQGWTALSEIRASDGVLELVPVPLATAYLLVKGIAGEIGALGDPTPAPERMGGGDDVIRAAIARIPSVRPGDTIWWHGDLLHGVEPAANRTRRSNVMYVPSSPRCARNDAYNAEMRAWFEHGDSPVDFPAEHYERAYVGRATVADLDRTGREQLGYQPVAAG